MCNWKKTSYTFWEIVISKFMHTHILIGIKGTKRPELLPDTPSMNDINNNDIGDIHTFDIVEEGK